MIVILGSCNLIPFTGLPIPFLSRGGTYQAIVFSFAGLMISLSQNNGRKYKESEVDPDVTEQLEIPYPGQDQAQ
jgi:cell division protein FtsW (lipid II flippase)